jgi:HPt (histidine-containing phosphotransfer) domain-containing protein
VDNLPSLDCVHWDLFAMLMVLDVILLVMELLSMIQEFAMEMVFALHQIHARAKAVGLTNLAMLRLAMEFQRQVQQQSVMEKALVLLQTLVLAKVDGLAILVTLAAQDTMEPIVKFQFALE